MAKRITRPAQPSGTAQPQPAPGSALTEPAAPAAAPLGADPGSAVAPAPEAPASSASTIASGGSPAPTPGAWPDVSNEANGPHCPWCSAALPSDDLTTCPSCGAQINAAAEADVPGVTTIDVAALAWKAGAPPRRNRLLSWISGDDDSPAPTPGTSSSAVEPPSLAVRREMLRLELEAEGISLPHDAEPAGADEAAAVAEAQAADPTSSEATAGDAGASGA
jgi:hypothetical protein